MRRRKLIVRMESTGKRWTLTLSSTDQVAKASAALAVRALAGERNLIIVNGADPLLPSLLDLRLEPSAAVERLEPLERERSE